LLRYAPENRSSPRVVTHKWLLKNYKLTARLKNKTWTNLQIKNHKKSLGSVLSDHRHNIKIQNTRVEILNTTNTICGENYEYSWVVVSL
jgi:hypothetical protein